jgi:hypothetical protein
MMGRWGFLILCLAGCSSATEVDTTQEFTVAPLEEVNVRGTDLSVAFLGVVSDSRCPLKAQCVWAGDASVEIQTWLNDADDALPRRDTLHTHEGPRSLDLGNVVLELSDLAPYPVEPGTIPPEEYRATLTAKLKR